MEKQNPPIRRNHVPENQENVRREYGLKENRLIQTIS